MWKSLCALSVAAVAAIGPALAQSQEMPKNFEETLKLIVYGDSTKSESVPRTVYGSTVKLAVTEVDDKNCTAGIVVQSDTPNYGEVKVTFTVDFKAVLKREMRGNSIISLEGSKTSPVVKSIKTEWLRVDTDEARKEKVRSDNEATSAESSPLLLIGDEKRAEEAMEYLLKTLCPNPNMAF